MKLNMMFKRPKSEIVRKAREDRIAYEAIYNFFSDDTINDEMITIGRFYHDGNDFEVEVVVEPYKFIYLVTYDSVTDVSKVRVLKEITNE